MEMAETFELHIDESGSFEKDNEQKYNKVRLIGGITAPQSLAQKKGELSLEIMEIGKKYFTQMRSPTDIHISDIDKYIPGKKPWDLRNELISFMNEKMDGARIFFIYDTTDLNREQALPEAQLYRNMLAHLLQTILFYHPHFSTKTNFNCMLAHRRFPYLAKFEDALAGHGYLKLKNPYNGKTFFTAITKAELEGIMTSVEKSLRFYSYRKASYEVKPYSEWKNPFMAMADCICNAVLQILRKSDSSKDIHRNLVGQFGKERILFYCPVNYDLPETLLTIYHQEQFAQFLSGYHRRAKNTPYSDNYLLFPAFIKSMNILKGCSEVEKKEVCNTLIGLADDFLEDRMFHRLDTVGDIIILVQEKMNRMSDTPDHEWDQLAFKYNDVGMRYSNHTGNTVKGNYYRDQGMKVYDRLSGKTVLQVRDYHEFINRASIIDANEFAFQKGITRLEPVKKDEEKLTELLGGEVNEILGKICGSLGQNYAFIGDSINAKNMFSIAKKHLNPKNYQQPSYRAHLALDNKDNDSYFKEICFLFGKDTFPGYMECIKTCFTNLDDYSFNLHLILKGMCNFPPDEHECLKILNEITINPFKPRYKNHPWELVFIVLGRLLNSIGEKKDARKFWEASYNFAKNNDQLTFIMIGHSARAWEALSWLGEGNLEKARNVLLPVVETFRRLGRENIAPGIFNPNKISDEDGKIRAGWFDDVGARYLNELKDAAKSTLESLCNDFINKFTFNYW
jgi:hypothetical protein